MVRGGACLRDSGPVQSCGCRWRSARRYHGVSVARSRIAPSPAALVARPPRYLAGASVESSILESVILGIDRDHVSRKSPHGSGGRSCVGKQLPAYDVVSAPRRGGFPYRVRLGFVPQIQGVAVATAQLKNVVRRSSGNNQLPVAKFEFADECGLLRERAGPRVPVSFGPSLTRIGAEFGGRPSRIGLRDKDL